MHVVLCFFFFSWDLGPLVGFGPGSRKLSSNPRGVVQRSSLAAIYMCTTYSVRSTKQGTSCRAVQCRNTPYNSVLRTYSVHLNNNKKRNDMIIII